MVSALPPDYRAAHLIFSTPPFKVVSSQEVSKPNKSKSNPLTHFKYNYSNHTEKLSTYIGHIQALALNRDCFAANSKFCSSS